MSVAVSNEYETIMYEVEDPVAVITLNRPDRLNAFTFQMGHELHDALTRAGEDKRVVGVVVTGAGRAFCAGADLRDIDPKDLERPASDGTGTDPRPADQLPSPLGTMLRLPKPVIAAINGPAAGMGAVIPLWADLRFIADNAILTMSFSQRGTVAESGTSWILPRLIGPAAALDLLLSSRRVGAVEAVELGLVNRVVPASELLDRAKAYVQELAATCSPASMATIKQQVYSELHDGLAAAVRTSGQLLSDAVKGGDIMEGFHSYLEKRPPQFARIGND